MDPNTIHGNPARICGTELQIWSRNSNLEVGFAGDVWLTIDHPFTILDTRGMNPPTYEVRYGFSAPSIRPSPLYQTVWHSRTEMKARGDVSPEAVDQAIRAFQESKRVAPPTPVSLSSGSLSPARSLSASHTSGDSVLLPSRSRAWQLL